MESPPWGSFIQVQMREKQTEKSQRECVGSGNLWSQSVSVERDCHGSLGGDLVGRPKCPSLEQPPGGCGGRQRGYLSPHETHRLRLGQVQPPRENQQERK